ncbi:MAG: hypothetical protein EXR86_11665 [Gammaproteobacteria bacterium]|nr:hypothetical protein [Gammaproteobacteria bacterium]
MSSTLLDYVMFYARRPSLDLKLSRHNLNTLHRQLAECPYVFMAAMKTYPPDRTPPLYPFTLLRPQLDVLATMVADPTDPKSQTIAMWARYRPAKKAENPG